MTKLQNLEVIIIFRHYIISLVALHCTHLHTFPFDPYLQQGTSNLVIDKLKKRTISNVKYSVMKPEALLKDGGQRLESTGRVNSGLLSKNKVKMLSGVFFFHGIPRKGSALTARNILECSSEKDIKRTSGQSLLTLQPARCMNMQPWSSSMQTDGMDS